MEKALLKTLSVVFLFITTLGYSQSGETITGQLLYHGVNGMPNVNVFLKNSSGAIISQTITGQSGNYEFTNVPQGTYTITFSSNAPAGGVNLSDAYLVMLHLMGMYPFDEYEFLASDVNGSGSVTWTDYFIIMINYLNQGNPFPIGPWVFESVPPFTTGSRTGVTSGGSSSGDANGTFVPTKESNLIYKEIAVEDKYIGRTREVEMSINTPDHLEIGGMHLVIRVPEGLSVTGVESPLPEFSYSLTGQELRVTWLDESMTGYPLNDTRALVTIKAQAKDIAGNPGQLSLDITEGSHFIGSNGEIISGMRVILPTLNLKMQEDDVVLTAYPNPFMDHATLGFQVPEDGQVIVRLYDNSGRCVQEVENSMVPAGNHQAIIDGSCLVPGMYHYSIRFEGNTTFTKTGTIIKSK